MLIHNENLMPTAVRLAQDCLDDLGLLQWATIAGTYTDEDNMRLVVMHPTFKQPMNIGLATFRGLAGTVLAETISPIITSGIRGALHANGITPPTP